MKRNIFLIILILTLSIQLSAKKITKKVKVHPTAESLLKEEIAILGVSKDVTVIEINKSKFKVNGDRIHIEPGRHTFQVKKPMDIFYDGELTRELEAGKYYVLDEWTESVSSTQYRRSYKIFEVSETEFENYDKKVLDRLIRRDK